MSERAVIMERPQPGLAGLAHDGMATQRASHNLPTCGCRQHV